MSSFLMKDTEVSLEHIHPYAWGPGPCSGKNMLRTLVTDYIQARKGHALLFSFECNLLPKFLTDYYDCMDQASGQDLTAYSFIPELETP